MPHQQKVRVKQIKKRGGFCRPPRQLYPQEERGIQRRKYRASPGGWQCSLPHPEGRNVTHRNLFSWRFCALWVSRRFFQF